MENDKSSLVGVHCTWLVGILVSGIGGVDGSNVADYLAAGAVGAGVSGCLFKKEWVKAGVWDRITEAAKNFVAKL